MATDLSGVPYISSANATLRVGSHNYIRTGEIRFNEIPTITLRNAPNDNSDDESRPPFAWSPLEEYRGRGSLSLRRIRTLGEGGGSAGAGRSRSPDDSVPAYDPTFAADRARSILREAHDAIVRILGVGNPVAHELSALMRRV